MKKLLLPLLLVFIASSCTVAQDKGAQSKFSNYVRTVGVPLTLKRIGPAVPSMIDGTKMHICYRDADPSSETVLLIPEDADWTERVKHLVVDYGIGNTNFPSDFKPKAGDYGKFAQVEVTRNGKKVKMFVVGLKAE